MANKETGMAEVKQFQVTEQRNAVDEEIEELYKALDELEIRLADVLRPSDVDDVNKIKVAPSLVPFAEWLRGTGARIYHAQVSLRSIIGRVEL